MQNIAKAYLRGVWDSIKGVSLIFIVIRDTYSSKPLQNEQDSELDESSSSSNTTHTTTKRPTRRSYASKREFNKLKEYERPFICNDFQYKNDSHLTQCFALFISEKPIY